MPERDMPSFLDQDRPKKVKEIYRALKRDHPDMPAEMKARIAARQGKRGKQKQGPPYKGEIMSKYKGAASKKQAPYQQTRKGRRPIRVHNLVKKASQSGQDLRSPLMGGTKMPTDDSKSFAKKQLSKHQSVGVPAVPKTTDITSTIPKSPGSINLMPKVSADMGIKNDPLVQYLARQEKEKRAMMLEDNEPAMPTGKSEKEQVSAPPDMPNQQASKGTSSFSQYMAEAFDAKVGKKKYEGKDYPAKSDQVDKVLRIS